MANWSGRMPSSYSITLYNDGTWNDSTPWSGIIINEQDWVAQRNQIGQLSYHHLIDSNGSHLIDSNGDRITGLATFASDNWISRTLPL